MTKEEFLKTSIVSRETMEKLSEYEIILKKWNKKINLVQENSIKDIWFRHFLNSLEILEWFQLRNEKGEIADLGSGAGFPGIPLALSGVKNITLIESDQRKASFLREAKRILNIDIKIENKRIEKVSQKFTFCTSRALASLEKLISYASIVSRETSQCIFVKGENGPSEIDKAREFWEFDVKIQKGRYSPETRILEIENWRRKK